MKFPRTSAEEKMKVRLREEPERFGFDEIIKVDKNPNIEHPSNSKLGPGDFVGIRDGEELLIEVENHLAGFFNHPEHIRDEIDVIICNRRYEKPPREKWKEEELKRKEVIETDHDYQPEPYGLDIKPPRKRK